MDMVMTMELDLNRVGRRIGLALGLVLASAAAHAQPAPESSGVSYDAPPAAEEQNESAPASEGRRARRERSRSSIQPYLEVTQVVSADLENDETLTYTSVAAGVDGRVETRRVTAQLSYRYERLIEWGDDVGDQDVHSGVAVVGVQVVPGALQFEAGALATRTGGEGRAIGVTDRDSAVEVYSVYAGPTLSTHAGPVAVNAAYRLGYVAIDDDSLTGGPRDDFSSATAHSATASVGMAPGRLPFGWTVGGGYTRTDSDSRFDDDFEGVYVRGDVVVPLSPTFAVTAGVGYEDIQASQLDVARDVNGVPILGPDGQPGPDPTRPRLVTYDLDGLIYDAGILWRPNSRTELQARAGHRYGGTTVVGSLAHRFSNNFGMNAAVFDSVETFGSTVINGLSSLPDDFNVVRNPLTGDLGGCAFGATPGSGTCLGQSLQSIRGTSFRARGASLVFSGNRGLWDYGAGAGYVNRRFGRPNDSAFDAFGSSEDESFSLFSSFGRRLSRSSNLDISTYASWYDSDLAAFDRVFSTGATVSYNRRLLFDRMQFLAALGLYHTSEGAEDSTVASALAGLRYTFW